jgi:hypothetical protein
MTKAKRGTKCHTIFMICYRVEDTPAGMNECSPTGVAREWFTTFNAAQRRLRKLGLSDECDLKTVEAPKSKVQLVEWLNSYAAIG